MFLPRGPPESQRKQLWRHAIIPLGLAILCLIITPLLFALVSLKTSSEAGAFCKPDGTVVLPFQGTWATWEVSRRTSLVWDASLALTVVLGFGQFTFSTAKAIDFCWDLVVGRGGQALLAILVYRVSQKSLFFTMEQQKVSLPAASANLTEGFGPATLWWMFVALANNGDTDRGYRRCRLLAVLFACGYVLVFASLTSLMTGYQATLVPYVHQPGRQSLVPLGDLRVPDLVVLDGSRIGTHDSYVASYYSDPDGRLVSPIAEYYDISLNISTSSDGTPTGTNVLSCKVNSCNFSSPLYHLPPPEDPGGDLSWNVSKGGLSWENELPWKVNSTLRFMDKVWNLTPPLQIVLYKQGATGSSMMMSNWGYSAGFGNKLMLALADDDKAYVLQWWQERSVCQTLNTYQWGFSSVFLFLFCVLTIAFAASLAFLQLELHRYSRLYRHAGPPGTYHFIIALATELQAVVSHRTDHWTEITEQELKEAIEHRTISADVRHLPFSRVEAGSVKSVEKHCESTEQHLMGNLAKPAVVETVQQDPEDSEWQRAFETERDRRNSTNWREYELPPFLAEGLLRRRPCSLGKYTWPHLASSN